MQHTKKIYAFIADKGNLVLLLFIVVSLAITWATIDQIDYNYRLEQQARTLEEQNAVLAQENANQELRNQFYQSEYYLELAARKQLGLVEPGEKVAIISQQAIDDIVARYPDEEIEQIATEGEKASPLEQWYRFFSGNTPL